MHAIRWAETPDGKRRPVVVLTRTSMLPYLSSITVAPITSTLRTSRTQVPVGPDVGLDHDSMINCDDIQTIPKDKVHGRIGELTLDLEQHLSRAITAAFDLL